MMSLLTIIISFNFQFSYEKSNRYDKDFASLCDGNKN